MNSFIYRELREHRVFAALLVAIPGLEDRLLDNSSSNEEILHIGELVRVPVVNKHHSNIVIADPKRFIERKVR